MSKYDGHTPGPWRVAKKDKHDVWIETSDLQWGICGMKAGKECARVSNDGIGMSEETYEANARLIADAPKLAEHNARMLDMLKEIETEVGHTGHILPATMDMVSALIAEMEEE